MKELLETILEKDKEEAEFDAIFRPATAEELEARAARLVEEVLEKSKCTQNPDGTWSCEGDVDLSDLNLKKFPVKFKRVDGHFYCNTNQLRTLEGAPEYVGGDFYCYDNQLTTLEGAPKEVKGFFDCDYNQLRSLKGAPRRVGENFGCDFNPVPEDELRKTVDRPYL